jgi:hypothetical protein
LIFAGKLVHSEYGQSPPKGGGTLVEGFEYQYPAAIKSASEYWWSERRVEMSERVIKSLRELMDNIEQNSASVESKLAINGSKPDSAIVMSAAKYHKALEMLAKE